MNKYIKWFYCTNTRVINTVVKIYSVLASWLIWQFRLDCLSVLLTQQQQLFTARTKE